MSDQDAFTRNPKDRYLTPVPPQPLIGTQSPKLSPTPASLMPLPSPWAPKSATYPECHSNGRLSPNVVRHVRSASASPWLASPPVFADFRALKDKLASKRTAMRGCHSPKPKELEIGTPVLISTTNEEVNSFLPLPTYQPGPVPSPRSSPAAPVPSPRPVPAIRKGFSPLAMHPVDPDNDSLFDYSGLRRAEQSHETGQDEFRRPSELRRRRSHVPSTVVTSEFKIESRTRANSEDTRRTRHYLFSNDPWLSSPKLQHDFEAEERLVADDTPPAPVLSRPSTLLGLPESSGRPTSSHGGGSCSKLRQSPLDKDKALPELPRYLTPAPLFACSSLSASPVMQEESPVELDSKEQELGKDLDDFQARFREKPRSHFSTWSEDSFAAYSCAASDDEAITSPTFSSLTSNCSEVGTPQRQSACYFSYKAADTKTNTPTIPEADDSVDEDEEEDLNSHTTYLSATPPQLDSVRISTFSPDFISFDFEHTESAPKRQAACFGLGVYSLPPDETLSKSTVTPSDLAGPSFNDPRESSVSQITSLIDDFAFLGEAVH